MSHTSDAIISDLNSIEKYRIRKIRDHITKELSTYYADAELAKRVDMAMHSFNVVAEDPLQFQFMEERAVNQDTFKVETRFVWKLIEETPNGSILIKD
jgi:hypothetical protein